MSTAVLPSPVAKASPRPWKWTLEQYYDFDAKGLFHGKRVEFIRGEIIEMSPAGWPHSVSVTRTADAMRDVFAGRAWIREEKPLNVDASLPEPDVAVIPGRMEDYTDHPTTALLLVEIADSSFFYDTTTKAELYATGGIADYWVLELETRTLHVFRDPAPIASNGHSYRTHLKLAATETVCPLAAPNAVIRLADLLP